MKQTIRLTENELKEIIKEVLLENITHQKNTLNESIFNGLSDEHFWIDGKEVSDQIHMRPRCSMKYIERDPDKTKFAFGRNGGGPGNVFYPAKILHDLNGDIHIHLEPMPTQA